jgi:hypothetical protein
LSPKSRDLAGFLPLREHAWQDILYLANSIVFAGSVVNRSHGYKHYRTLDEVRSATSWVALEVTLARPWSHRPVGGGTAFRRSAAGMDAVILSAG